MADNIKKCPMLGGKKCIKDQCALWCHLIGINPQTGQPVDEFGCSIAMLPILLIENAKNVAGAQAAVESFRNKSIDFQDSLIGAFTAMKQLGTGEVKKVKKQLASKLPKEGAKE